MRETQLKEKFIQYLRKESHHNFFENDIKPIEKVIEIKNEALSKKFDFILAIIRTKNLKTNKMVNQSIEIDDDLKNIYTRNKLVQTISKEYKVKLQDLTIYPIEIKSDQDKLDKRLANQIIEAILSFGRSVIILDNKHSQKIIKNGLKNILPAKIIGFFEDENKFVLINDYDRIYVDSLLTLSKFQLIKTLRRSDLYTNINVHKLNKNLKRIQQINQKLIYNQIFSKEYNLLEEEIKFLMKLSQLDQNISMKKEIIGSIKRFSNQKITDFIEWR